MRDVLWRNALADDPPGGSNVEIVHDVDVDVSARDGPHGIQSTLDSAKDNAMAVTGAPRSLPIDVVLPRSCAIDAANDNAATFPQASDGDMMEWEEEADDTTGRTREASRRRRRRTMGGTRVGDGEDGGGASRRARDR